MLCPHVTAVVGWAVCTIASMALWTAPRAAADVGPQALVVVLPRGATAEISITFPQVVPHAVVGERLDRLARAGGWAMSALVVRDEKPLSGLGPQTGAIARLSGSPFARNGGFVLQPLLETFRDLSNYEILYFVPPQPDFAGLRKYESAALSIRLIGDGGVGSNPGKRAEFVHPYHYVVENHSHTGALPVVPLTQPMAGPSTLSNRTASSGSTWAGGAGAPPVRNGVYWPIVVLAAGSGLFVYVVLRMQARR